MEIIVSHNNTDLDGLAAMVAAKKLYPDAELVCAGKLHRNVREFMSLHKDTLNVILAKDVLPELVERLILVDTKSASRIGELKQLVEKPGIDIHIYDHHPRSAGDVPGSLEVIEPLGAATTLLVEKIKEKELEINPFEATIFALGIYEDTGCLTFNTTTPRDAQAVAYLLAQGAKLSVVADFIGRPLSEEQKTLLNTLIISAENLVVNGVKVLIAKAETDEYVDGLSLLTHKLAEVAHIDVVFAVVHMDDRVHMVARSRLDSVDVGEVLGHFNGGGHASAASATVRNGDVEELVEKLRGLLRERIRPETVAADIMSAPVKTLTMLTSIEEAGKIMLRYGHTGLPVVDGEKMVGIISRRDIDKAKHHGLGHAPVKGFMSHKVITIMPYTTLPEIQHLMIEHNIGRLPIIDKDRIIGIVSRTDVLRTLHGESYPERYERVYNITQPVSDRIGDNVTDLMARNLPPNVRDLLGQISYLADQQGCAVFAVGGFVRDLLMEVENLDIDLVVEGDGITFARSLAEFLCGRVRIHNKFGTAMVILPDHFRVDVATARTEYYEYPAALPKVEVSSLKQDLYRRDFTINAMAITLSEKNFGALVDYFGGRRDLEEGIISVLYNLSFVEDPTRILRAVRFEQRYNFHIESQTLNLAKGAIKTRMLAKLSADRVREELKHILTEAYPSGAIRRMQELGIWRYILPEAVPDEETLALTVKLPGAMGFVWDLGMRDYELWLIYLVALLHKSSIDAAGLEARLRLTRDEQFKVAEILRRWRDVLEQLDVPRPMKMSEIAGVLREFMPEGYIFILAKSEAERVTERIKNYLARSLHNKLAVTGEDIKKLGYKPGPAFKDVLDVLRDARLDGLVQTREDELHFAREYLANREEQ